ncbi:WD40 repeat-like-containing domain protein [Cordyceps fumosorosea ARSEF 2679]|uniref:WD40 repeat-like-containing domain protein n=1 Tax=Cordyceps fumosorosea (strain ARSEF 2679) TaxID=1081104 RepID=A0A167MDB5_CORFA|nr:WD40 repeat-like-containing domain protein [Cordyceps fumosorosea ARSEF 2679]OAA54228.1 WD40 repeat-like-containing domain protein [Cordyceps fumosorosea ARSEF 2679]
MTSSTPPRIRRTTQNTLLTYNLSRRIHDVQTYPIQSPQGATILIYGHETGVTVVWRGGRRFKPSRKPEPVKQQQNGGAADAGVMVIDSDDEEPPASKTTASATGAFVDKPEFEAAIEEGPYPEIIQTLDLTLGASVLHVAVPPDSLGGDKLVFAVSCAGNDAYVITLPSTPPSPESKARPELRVDLLAGQAGSGAWGELLIALGGQTRPSDGLAIALAQTSESTQLSKPPRLIVAAHSKQASGVLRLWDVALDLKSDRSLEPFQTEYLPSPLKRISFNPTHSTQLLTVSATDAVRIYDYAAPSILNDPDSTGPFPSQGSWLLSLYQPFAKPSSARKPILDAAWISKGQAVFVLLADGMWGIWDIDGVSPLSASANMSTKLKSGVRGAALTAFSISGYIEGTGSLRSIANQQKEAQQGEFAPMTPHTRKQATASLSSTNTLDRLSSVHGGVRTTVIPSPKKSSQEEALVLWLGGLEHVCVVPAVSRFWESQLNKGSTAGVNLFSGGLPTRMIKLADLSTGLLGEPCRGVDLIPARSTGSVAEGGMSVEVVIRGETRLVIAQDGDESGSKKLSLYRPRRLFSKEHPSAIIVHGETNRARPNLSFNLSTAKAGSLRLKSTAPIDQDHDMDDVSFNGASRPRVGFDFANTLSAAADESADISRDVEAEMLGIMEIDQALDSMNGTPTKSRKRVFFDE